MSDDLSGRALGRYQVLERLGRGGMAEVYRAYQPSLDRYVAIKVIYPHLASDPALLERFGREARAVAALHHPNIVQVHDFDVQAGSAFMAMEFISGPTLKAVIQSMHQGGRLLPLPVVGQIIGQLGDALGYAHEQRLVHRDVKPANVLVRRRGPADTPLGDAELEALMLGLGPSSIVLTDFGVARIIKDSVEHTAAGTILGSPAYMSPEQGRGERVDARTDIYSLGIVLYELLTGQVPFDADTPFAIVMKHSMAPLPPPRSLRPDLPAPVEQVLLKALAKDPADRFVDAAAFASAVREATGRAGPAPAAPPRPAAPLSPAASRETRVVEFTAAMPPPAPAVPKAPVAPAPPAAPARRRSVWRTMLLALLALVVVSLVTVVAFIAGGAVTFQGLNQVGALVVPTEYSQQATAAAIDGSSLEIDPTDPASVALVAGRLSCGGVGCPGGNPGRALEIYNLAIEQAPDSAELLAARAQLYVWWDPFAYAEQAGADIAAALGADDESAAAYLARAGLTAALAPGSAERAQARADYDHAIELAPDLSDARLGRAAFLAGEPDIYSPDSPSRAQLIADADAVLATRPRNVAALNLRGEAFYGASQFDRALADAEAVLAIDPGNVGALMRRGRVHRFSQDKLAEAQADFAAVLAIDPQNGEARRARAELLAMAGDYAGALADVDALMRAEPQEAVYASMRGFIQLGLGQPADALRDFERALALAGAPAPADARYGRGLALLALDRSAEAIDDLEAAAQEQDALAGVQEIFSGGRGRAQLDLARAYIAAGRDAEAAPLLDQAVERNPSWYLPYLLRARYRAARGDKPGAREDLRSAASFAASDAERAEVQAEPGGQP